MDTKHVQRSQIKSSSSKEHERPQLSVFPGGYSPSSKFTTSYSIDYGRSVSQTSRLPVERSHSAWFRRPSRLDLRRQGTARREEERLRVREDSRGTGRQQSAGDDGTRAAAAAGGLRAGAGACWRRARYTGR